MPHLDHVADASGAELYRLSKLYSFPDFVKSADLDLTRRPGSLAVTVYADPRNKEFPCHPKTSTWLSAAFFYEKRAERRGFYPASAVGDCASPPDAG